MSQPQAVREVWRGLDCTRITLPHGDNVRVADFGAQVLSWTARGRERLFLSERAVLDGSAAIRGGVPVCFPQFNQRGPAAGLPKHGFARNLPWQAGALELAGKGARLTLRLCSSAASHARWPEAFALALVLDLQPNSLRISLQVRNQGDTPWAFTGALHSYLAVDDVQQAWLTGLQGQLEWDAVRDAHGQASAQLRFGSEFDRVYTASLAPLVLHYGSETLTISQSPEWAQTVVWNPGAQLCATLADMEREGWRQMLCVEAAQVYTPISVAPGQTWQGWQQLTVG